MPRYLVVRRFSVNELEMPTVGRRSRVLVEDEFPEITESLLQILYPHYLAPIPSMSVVQFALDPAKGKLAKGFTIDRHRRLLSKPGLDTRCRFRTCYPVTLWPIEVEAVRLDAPGPVDAAGRQAVASLTLSLRAVRDANLARRDTARYRRLADHARRIEDEEAEALAAATSAPAP